MTPDEAARGAHAATQPPATAAAPAATECPTVEERLRALEAERRALAEQVDALESRNRRQSELLEHFRAELTLRTSEVRYQLGDALVRAATHPLDLLRLPLRLAQLLARGVAQRRARSAADGAPAAAHAAALRQPQPAPEFRAVRAPDGPPRLPVRLAVVLDEFTWECLRPECTLIPLTPENWQAVLTRERPDLLFVESAWRGNGGAWQGLLTDAVLRTERSPIFALVAWCRAHGIPTVFWNKEDPPNFEHFIDVARAFEFIFTTDENCIPRYRERVGHDRVWALPFAAQPAIHNPVDSRGPRLGNLCFGGTYYAARHAGRRGDVELLLQPALARGLTIFDRMHDYARSENYRFPPEYAEAIRGALPYPQMVDAYKRYRVFLNVNSVTDSPTMFSRRVLELLACGTPVISTPALGIPRLLGPDAVAVADSPAAAAAWMDRLLGDPDVGERMVLRGQRRIFAAHTYEHRLRLVLEKIGRPLPAPRQRVSVVTCTNRPDFLENALANYQRQTWPDKELLLVLNHDGFVLDEVRRRLADVPDARVVQIPQSQTLGACLNRSIDETDTPYWTKFDDDNWYGPEFLTDLMHAFGYARASLVGKCTYYAYLEGRGCLALRFPDQEHRYVDFLSGSAMVVARQVLEEVRFPEQNVGEDTQFLRACAARGYAMYATDRFNYVVRRAAPHLHTWQVAEDEYLEKCRVVAATNDYHSLVTV